jgi:hypothetical protein
LHFDVNKLFSQAKPPPTRLCELFSSINLKSLRFAVKNPISILPRAMKSPKEQTNTLPPFFDFS